MADLTDQTLDLIKKYESEGKNVRNSKYSETSNPPRTAQGYYQITNQNWNALAPGLGIDLKKYPNAMAAEEGDQRKVARHLLLNTPNGVMNWSAASNPKFLDEWDKLNSMPQQDIDYDKLSKEELLKLKAQTEAEIAGQNQNQLGPVKSPGPVKAPTSTSGFKALVTAPDDPELTKRQFPPKFSVQGGYVIPGLKKIARGVMGGLAGQPGYEPEESRFRSGASDIMEGAQDLLEPGLIGAAIGTGAAEGPGALLPFAGNVLKRGALATGVSELGGIGSKVYDIWHDRPEDPVNQRFYRNLGGWLGGFSPEMYAKLPPGIKANVSQYGPSLVGAAIGHTLGLPYGVGEFGGAILGGKLRGRMGGPVGPAPKGDVKSPKPTTLPRTPEMDDAVHFGNVDETAFKDHMKGLGLTDAEAQTKWNNAVSRSNKIKFDEAKEASEKAQAQQEKTAKEAKRDAEKQAKEAKEAAEQDKGPSAKEFEDLKDMVATGRLPSDQFRERMSRWMDPARLEHHIQEALGRWLGPPPQKVQFQPQNIPQNLNLQPQGPPQGLVNRPPSGFSQPKGEGSTGGELSNLTKFKPQFGPQGPEYGPPEKPYTPPPEPEPVPSTKLVHNASQALFKGNYDLDKIPADNRDWRQEFMQKNKLASVPTEKTVREAAGIARFLRAKAARGENVPGVKIGRNEKGQWVRVDAP